MNELTREQVELRCKNVNDIGRLAWECNELLAHDAALRTTIEQQAQELKAWRTGGVTEEILRKHDGWLKVGKGCLIVREDELHELKQAIAQLQATLAAREERIREMEDKLEEMPRDNEDY